MILSAKGARTLCLCLSVVVPSLPRLHAEGRVAMPVKGGRASTRQIAQSAKSITPAVEPAPGERKFQANCGRCHNPPEQLSPRIAGAVLRHMRVRASLSAEDERDILRYLAP